MNNIEKFKSFLQQYQPFDDIEEAERQSFIQFIDTFDGISYSRDNLVAHLSSSCWIVNKERTKVLMIFHNQFQDWSWVGGHADNDTDLLHVALKETEEETSLKNLKILSSSPIDLNVMAVHNHYKRGKFVPRHLHYNVVYAFEADESDMLRIKPDENSAIQWIACEDIKKFCTNNLVLFYYDRIMEKIKKIS